MRPSDSWLGFILYKGLAFHVNEFSLEFLLLGKIRLKQAAKIEL